MRFPITAFFVALFITACEPSGFPDDIDAITDRWSAARVDFLDRCVTPHTILGEFGRNAEPTLASIAPEPTSRGAVAAEFLRHFDDDTKKLDRDAFDRCVSAHENIPACPEDPMAFFVRAGCATMFVGAREEGEGCAVDAVCAEDLFCDAVPGECGRCAPSLRGPPIDDVLALDRMCVDDPMCGLARAGTNPGDACQSNCGNGLYPALACIDGVCVERRVVEVGDLCDPAEVDVPWNMRSVAHCKESDFGSTVCALFPVDETFTSYFSMCTAVLRGDPAGEGTAGVFVPGATVIGTGVGGAAFVQPVECAP